MKEKTFTLIISFIILMDLGKYMLVKSFPKSPNKKIDLGNTSENASRYLQESNKFDDNYILLFFKEDCQYSQGFKNDFRNSISYIINRENNSNLTSEETLIVHKDF